MWTANYNPLPNIRLNPPVLYKFKIIHSKNQLVRIKINKPVFDKIVIIRSKLPVFWKYHSGFLFFVFFFFDKNKIKHFAQRFGKRFAGKLHPPVRRIAGNYRQLRGNLKKQNSNSQNVGCNNGDKMQQ